MRRIGVSLLVMAVTFVAAWAAPAPPAGGVQPQVEIIKPRPFSEKKDPPIKITWRTDLDAAAEEAARTGRLVLAFFYAEWSQPCKWMDEGTFGSRPVAGFVVRNFIPVKIDDSGDTSAVSRRFQIRVYPTLLFLDAARRPLHMVLGPRPPDKLYPLLKEVAALPGLIDAQKKAPDDLEANFAIGNAFAKLNQLRRGEPYLKRAAALAPKNENGRLSQARLILAAVPLEDGDSALAMENIVAYLKEFKDAPDVPVAIFYQGTILFQDGKLEESRGYFEQVRQRFPKHPKAYDADKAIESIDARLKAKAAQQNAGPKAAPQDPGSKAASKPPAPAPVPAKKPVG